MVTQAMPISAGVGFILGVTIGLKKIERRLRMVYILMSTSKLQQLLFEKRKCLTII
jgi:hypothetical protein